MLSSKVSKVQTTKLGQRLAYREYRGLCLSGYSGLLGPSQRRGELIFNFHVIIKSIKSPDDQIRAEASLPGIPWSLPLWIFRAPRSKPTPWGGAAVNSDLVTCEVKELSVAATSLSTNPRATESTPPFAVSYIAEGLKKICGIEQNLIRALSEKNATCEVDALIFRGGGGRSDLRSHPPLPPPMIIFLFWTPHHFLYLNMNPHMNIFLT